MRGVLSRMHRVGRCVRSAHWLEMGALGNRGGYTVRVPTSRTSKAPVDGPHDTIKNQTDTQTHGPQRRAHATVNRRTKKGSRYRLVEVRGRWGTGIKFSFNLIIRLFTCWPRYRTTRPGFYTVAAYRGCRILGVYRALSCVDGRASASRYTAVRGAQSQATGERRLPARLTARCCSVCCRAYSVQATALCALLYHSYAAHAPPSRVSRRRSDPVTGGAGGYPGGVTPQR